MRFAVVGTRGVDRLFVTADCRAEYRLTAAVVVGAAKDPMPSEVTSEVIRAESLEQLFQLYSREFDAVLISAEDQNSIERGCQAANAGKHVLIELSLTSSKVSVADLVRACAEAKVTLMVSQPRRFAPSVRTVKDSVLAGKIGEPGLLRIHCWQAGGKSKSLNRAIAEEVGLSCWLFDKAPTRVFAVQQPGYLQTHLIFSAQGSAVIDLSSKLTAPSDYYSLTMIGSTGAAYADDHHNQQLLFRDGVTRAEPVLRPNAGNVREQLVEFCNRAASASGAADAVPVAETLESIRRSLESGASEQVGVGP